ncbi:hypothetical protein GLOIN_2v1495217 [Rhizophagus clarus]|uniref:Uncharacterized protein n=1 Tax=Rhizophagus clarus TaxID=94130 RepID=A0A8H3LIX6_9GLOM|nr:hypothetical protein GLOIN_2v1495217 [Rhizophagus clarus]
MLVDVFYFCNKHPNIYRLTDLLVYTSVATEQFKFSKMYKTVVTKYLTETKYGHWSIISILEYTKSKCRLYVDSINDLKSDIYASLRSYRAKDNHEQEQRGFDTAFDINVTSACTVKALEGYCTNQARIGELKNNEHEDGGPTSRFLFRKRAKINYAEPSCSSKEETDSDYEKDEEQKTKKASALSSEIRVNTLPSGTIIAKPTPLDLTPSDESEDNEPSVNEYDDDDDNDDIPDPDSVLDSFPNNSQKWRLPSGKSAEDIFTANVSKNSKTCKKKKKLTAIEKAAMRYGASRIIDLSAHMRAWFSPSDRAFMAENHKELLKIPELPDEVNTFISEVEKLNSTEKSNSIKKDAERVMSTLNIGLQGVALKHDQMSSGSKALFKMANTLDDIRKKAQKSNKKFRCHEPANEESIVALFESISDIDSTLRIEETT